MVRFFYRWPRILSQCGWARLRRPAARQEVRFGRRLEDAIISNGKQGSLSVRGACAVMTRGKARAVTCKKFLANNNVLSTVHGILKEQFPGS